MGMIGEFHPIPKQTNIKKIKDANGHNRYYITGTCADCGEYFEKRKDKAKHTDLCIDCAKKHGNAERQGKIMSYRKGKTKTCTVCGTEFYATPNRSISAKYCSQKCYLSTQKDKVPKGFIGSTNNSGKKNGRYKDGKRVGEHVTKPKVRKQVIERDGNWCLLCGKPPKGLHLHRVVYGSQGGKYEKSNCVQLCAEDHALMHSNKKIFQPLLEKYLKMATEQQSESEPIEPPGFWHEWIKEFRGE